MYSVCNSATYELICDILAYGVMWICFDWFDMNKVEHIDENWEDSQNAYVNTAIAYLVILTSGSGCLL